MEAKTKLNKVRALLGMDISLETRKLTNGTTLEAEEFSKGNEVFILAEDSEKIALPKGNYELEDGVTLYVQEEGIIASLGEDRGEDDDEAAVDDWAGRIKNLEDAVADLKERLSDEDEKIDDEKEEEDAEAEEEEKEEFVSAKKEIELNEIEQVAHSPEKANAKRVTFGQTKRYANNTQARVFEALFGDNN